MATVTEPAATLLTAEEFARRPGSDWLEELVRGRVEIVSPPPRARHGQVCSAVGRLLGNHAREHDLGHVVSNDSGVITERDPDTVRGADVAFYSYAKVPRGPLPAIYLGVPPELIIEVLSPDDRWSKVLKKVAEYLNVGVAVVGVLDPDKETLHLFEPERPVRVLSAQDEFHLPDVLGDFRVRVRQFLD